MTYWTVVILSVYLVVVLIIGFYSSRGAGKDAESFFVASRHLNWLQEAMAVFTAIAPAGALMGTIGLFYRVGGNMLGYVYGYAFMMPLTYWYIGSRLRRLGQQRKYQTQAMFIRDFYQSRYLRLGVAIVGIGASIPYFMVNPVALGELLHLYTGFPYFAGILLFVVIATAYTLTGGLRAVANTDIFHGVLLLLFLLTAVIVLVTHAGGIAHVLATPKAAAPVSGTGVIIFLAWIFHRGFGTSVEPDRCFRMFALRDDFHLRRGVIVSAAMTAFAGFSYYATGLAVHSLIPNLAKSDTALATSLEVVAVWLIPWFVMNCWGAGMSSFTSGMLSSANIFVKDLFEPWYLPRHNLSGEKRDQLIIKVSRLFIVFLALVTVCVGFFPPPFIWSLINLKDGLILQAFPMFMLGFLWPRITRVGVIFGWTAGLGCVILWTFFFQPPFGPRIPMTPIDSLIVNTVVLVIVSLAVGENEQAKRAREEMRQLANPKTEVEKVVVGTPELDSTGLRA